MMGRVKTALTRLTTPRSLTGLYALFLLTVYLLWVPEGGYGDIVNPKHTLFLRSAGIFFPLLITACCFDCKQCFPRPFPPRLYICLGLALAMGLWVCLTAAVSAYPEVVWLGDRRHEGALTMGVYLGIFLAGAVFLRLGRPHAWGASLTALLSFPLTLLQFLGKNPLGLYPGDLLFHHRNERYAGEYMGTVGNSGLLGAVMTVLCLYLLGSYLVRAKKDRFLYLAGGLAAWGTILMTEVSAAPVAVLGCFALGLPLLLRRGWGLRRLGEVAGGLCLLALGKLSLGYAFESDTLSLFFRWNGLSWVLLGLFLLCAIGAVLLRRLPEGKQYSRAAGLTAAAYVLGLGGVLLFLYFYPGNGGILGDLSLLLHGQPPESLGSGRIAIWKDALGLIRQRPLLGGGPDTYNYLSDFSFSRVLANGTLRRVAVDAAHNEYLQLWVCCGLPALLLHLGLLGFVTVSALGRGKKKSLGVLLPVVGYGIYALFGISQSLSAPLYYLMLGALAGEVLRPGDAPEEATPQEKTRTEP